MSELSDRDNVTGYELSDRDNVTGYDRIRQLHRFIDTPTQCYLKRNIGRNERAIISQFLLGDTSTGKSTVSSPFLPVGLGEEIRNMKTMNFTFLKRIFMENVTELPTDPLDRVYEIAYLYRFVNMYRVDSFDEYAEKFESFERLSASIIDSCNFLREECAEILRISERDDDPEYHRLLCIYICRLIREMNESKLIYGDIELDIQLRRCQRFMSSLPSGPVEVAIARCS